MSVLVMLFLVRRRIGIFENAVRFRSAHFWVGSTQTGTGERLVPSNIDIVVSSLGEDAINNFLQLKGYIHDDSFALGDADDYLSNFASGGLHVCRYRSSGQSVDVIITEVCSCYC
jgi:hypothetical protein